MSVYLPTKEQAIDEFFNRFGTFYEESAVPDGDNKPTFPYGTYELATGSYGDEVPISAKWWERSSSWVPLIAKVREFENALAAGQGAIRCVGGGIRIRPGTPFTHNGVKESDPALKSKIFNFTIEFVTSK